MCNSIFVLPFHLAGLLLQQINNAHTMEKMEHQRWQTHTQNYVIREEDEYQIAYSFVCALEFVNYENMISVSMTNDIFFFAVPFQSTCHKVMIRIEWHFFVLYSVHDKMLWWLWMVCQNDLFFLKLNPFELMWCLPHFGMLGNSGVEHRIKILKFIAIAIVCKT